jgi:tripartite-type tricarboxylate transporter receptor subunit TctC
MKLEFPNGRDTTLGACSLARKTLPKNGPVSWEQITSTSWGTLKSSKSDWLRDKRINLLLFYMGVRIPEAPHVPAAGEMGLTEEGRQILKLYSSGADIGRSLVAPPGTPAERVAEFRRAFDLSMADAGLREEIKRSDADFAPLSCAEMQTMVANILNSPPALINRMKRILESK